jgi:hypothetical protein
MADDDRCHAASSSRVRLPGRVCLLGLAFHKSRLDDRVRVAELDPCWAGCVALALGRRWWAAREEFGPRENQSRVGYVE